MYQNELYHHGVKGQKWGVRRYQNYDGTSKEKREFQARKNLKTAGANLYRVEEKVKKDKSYRNEVIKKSISEINKAEKILGKQEADKYLAAGYRNQSIKSAAIKSIAIAGATTVATAGLGLGLGLATAAGAIPVNAALGAASIADTAASIGRNAAIVTQAGSKGYRAATSRQNISRMTGRKFKN